ncbi:MAG: glycosyltransferase [Lachnospiraceae bacterium]|nr:glycosyltransferase [Lachnospiraceae bacterium]
MRDGMKHSDCAMFSIIVVCLNAGERLWATVESVLRQSYENYEIVIKDGISTDGSVKMLAETVKDSRLHIYQKKDSGIYDAMNQAVALAGGDYVIFMNAGDSFYDETVLDKISNVILTRNKKPDILYGNLYQRALATVVYSAPEINDFTCYRNVPCHQTCFYSRKLFAERAYDPKYNVRADYEHFLWCFYEKKADIVYVPVIVASYEGGGYSETKENKKRSKKQHQEITQRYMGRKKARKYRLIMLMTLAPLRSAIADNKYLSVFYNGMKTFLYKIMGAGVSKKEENPLLLQRQSHFSSKNREENPLLLQRQSHFSSKNRED